MFQNISVHVAFIASCPQEYLISSMTLPAYRVISHEAHADVFQLCVRYVSVFLREKSTRGNVALLESFPMLSYVLSSGFNHIAHIDPESIVVLEALRSLDSHIQQHPSHWDRLCEFREEDLRWPYPTWPSSRHDIVLYMLIAYSSHRLLHSFLLSSRRPWKPRLGTNPLVYAADLRKTRHAMILLAYGADMNLSSLVTDGSHNRSPLEVAIDVGDDALVGELLRQGCVVTTEVLSTAICMPWCSTRILARLVQTGEFVEWGKEIGHEELFRGVFNSARPNAGDSRQTDEDHVALARRLREIGQDLSPDSPFAGELIARAVIAAHTSTLEYLLPPDDPPPAECLLLASIGHTPEMLHVVYWLLWKGADVNASWDESGDTALHLAALCPWEPRSLELTKILIYAGCNPNARNLQGETPLILSVRHGYLSVVEYLLSSNVLLPSSILPIALENLSSLPVVGFLVRKGADVHSTTSNGNTVLHLAVLLYSKSMCSDLVEILIETGWDCTIHNSEGETVFDVAFKRGYISVVEQLLFASNVAFPLDILPVTLRNRSTPHIIESLVLKGANVQSTTSNGDSTLHLAIANYLEETCLHFVKRFIETGCDLIIRGSQGGTVLEAAIKHGYTSVVEHLISCNVHIPSHILPFALQSNSTFRMIDLLVRNGADVDSTMPPNEDTVLHLAFSNYPDETRLDLANILIEAGCDPTIPNSLGKTTFDVAIECGYSLTIKHLLSSNVPPPDTLPIALRDRSSTKVIELLIRKGASVHSTMPNGDTVLHLAVANYSTSECLDLIDWFVKAGCNPTIQNSEGKTVFDVAFIHNSTLVGQLLAFNVPLPSNILPIALQNRCATWMVQHLLRNGANVNSVSSDGDTVLHLLIANYTEATCLHFVKRFIEVGCDPTARSSQGHTILEAAIKYGYTLVVEHLISCNVRIPPDILLFALRNRTPPRMIEFLVRNGVRVNSITPNGDTTLHLAVAGYSQSTCLNLVKIFVGAGVNAATRNYQEKNVFEVAFERGYISAVEHLISPDFPLPHDVLLVALQSRSTPQVIEALVRNGADVNYNMPDGDSVLHLAYSNYIDETHLDLVNMFIEAGCDPTLRNSKGKTAFDVAIERGHTSIIKHLHSSNDPLPPDVLLTALLDRSSPKVIELLVRKGADVHSTMPNGNTVLHLAVAKYSASACIYLISKFIEVGCNLTRCNTQGNTVLEVSIKRGYVSVVGYLISCNVRIPPNVLLFLLQDHATPRMIELLVRGGADVNSTTSNWDTVLHLVIANYAEATCLDLINMFVGAGCDPTIQVQNAKGETVLDVSIRRGYASAMARLVSCGVPILSDTLPFALQNHSPPQMVELLVRNGVDVNSTTPNGDTVLHLVVANYVEAACLHLVNMFIEAGCDPTTRGSQGDTVLEASIKRGYVSVVGHLVSRNVWIPLDVLQFALQNHSPPRMVERLVRAVVDVRSTTSNGHTALHPAIATYVEPTCLELVETLVNAGCDPMTRDSHGETALEAAIKRGYVSVTEYLLSRGVPHSRFFCILSKALQQRCNPLMIRLLARKCTGHVTVSQWDALLPLARVSYSGRDRQWILLVLRIGQKTERMYPQGDNH